MHTFVLACIIHPQRIPTAQREIDAVVGEDRLPSFEDRTQLPYVEAIRPFDGAPQSTADDIVEYKGKEYFILKGSIIVAVPWLILYTCRAACPDIPSAEHSLWINIAMLLWTFNIHKSDELDPKTGLPFKYDDSDSAFSGGPVNAPFKFPAVFEPRSVQVVRQEWADCEKDVNVLLPQRKEQ
ncbi:Cytochrome P450 2B19 [Mycena sanguinolenta]|uniref:Cytochrome P450 2B19 n=1 Tax=Mycena sanguinolenta TaxID=230812 RepID=A0A8H6XJR3_9AGAR|nr:Cytochrome P450 2B19 [Mycena sanguinolenta]